MWNKWIFGSASHFVQTLSNWKAGSPTSATHCSYTPQSRQVCSLVCSSRIAQLRAQSLYCNKPWRAQLRDQTLCSSAWWQDFSVAATKGWAWCNRTGGCKDRRSQYCRLSGSLKLLTRSGCLKIPQWNSAGIDSLDKHVEQISFRQCVTFCEHRQLKGWQPRVQPTVAKSSISTTVHGGEQSHSTTESTITALLKHFLATTTPWPNPLLLCMMTGLFFCSCNEGMGMMQAWFNAEIGRAYASLSGTWSFWSGVDAWHFPQEWQEWTPWNKHVRIMPRKSHFRQCITFREHRQLKGWQPRFQTHCC